jgi:hypothetical protein
MSRLATAFITLHLAYAYSTPARPARQSPSLISLDRQAYRIAILLGSPVSIQTYLSYSPFSQPVSHSYAPHRCTSLADVYLPSECLLQACVLIRNIQGHHNTPLHAMQHSGMPAVACWLKIGAGITVKSVTGLYSVVLSYWDHMGII